MNGCYLQGQSRERGSYMAKTPEEAISEGGRLYTYYDENGEKIGSGFLGFDVDPNSMVGEKVSPTTDGGYWYPKDEYDIKTSIKLDTDTGNIKISAPKDIYEMPEFKNIFNEDKLKEYSQAYKLNPNYKVTWVEKNKETGKDEEKDVTIPEFVEKLNSSLDNFVENHKAAITQRNTYAEAYGKKARNLSDTQIAMTIPNDKAVYLPSSVLGVSSFGGARRDYNPFKSLIKDLGSNGEISIDKLKEVYKRSNFGREDMANILATIDGTLRGSDWSVEDYYTDEEGNQVYNPNSANEAAKLLSFRNFILSNDPEAEWWQQAGDNIESLGMNALYGFDRVFMNIGNLIEAPLTGAHAIENEIKDMDKAFGTWNQQGSLVNDATQAFATIGMLGGTLAGTVAAGKLGGSLLDDITKGLGKISSLSSVGTAAPEMATFAMQLGEAEIAANIISNIDNITKGARFAIGMMSLPQKTAMLANMAINGVRTLANANIITEFLFDTVHDAFLYDSTTLRDALESSDQQTRDYWFGQLADNAKWWAGMGAARTAIKYAGKSTLGKAADAVVTPAVNKLAARIGETKQSVKDYMAGGSVVRKLESKLADAIEKGNDRAANRLKRQIAQEEWNSLTREARKALGNIKLDWDGVKLTEKSLEEFNNLRTRVKALENGIDAYNRNISWKRQEMVGAVYEPSTGTLGYINPSLAGANVKTTDFYMKLSDLGKKYNLPVAQGSMISQDMVDYMVGRYYEGLATSFARGSAENAAKASNALETIRSDLGSLRERLPAEVVNTIDNGVSGKIYQSYYLAQNEYGIAKGLLDKEKIMSYDSNPIWQENGYMPIVVQHEKLGYWVENTGKIDAVIEQDFNNLTFNVKPGQHYADPELVRQSRLSNMARAEVNAQMFKAYSGFGSNATNKVLMSGEETAYVRRMGDNRKTLENAIQKNSTAAFEENFNVEAQLTKRRKPVKNEIVSEDTRSTVVSSMSPAQTTDFLVQKKVLPNSDAKLTDGVTEANYDEWYNGLNDSAKKYLIQNGASVAEENFGLEKYKTGGKGLKAFAVDPNEPSARFYNEHIIGVSPAGNTKEGKALSSFFANSEIDKTINLKLRNGELLTKAEQKAVENLRGAFTQQIDENVVAFRGMRLKEVPKVGDDFIDNGFGYVSLTPEVSKLYATVGKQSDTPVIFLYHLEKGQNVAAPRLTPDREMLLPDGYSNKVSKVWKDTEGTYKKGATIVELGGTVENNFNSLQKAIKEGGDDFEAGLQRAYLIGDKSFAKTSLMNEAARNLVNGKDAFYQGVLVAKIKGETRNILNLDIDGFWDDMSSTIRGQVDDYVAMVKANPGAKTAMDVLAETSDGADDTARYIALRQLKKTGMDNAYKSIDSQIDSLNGIGELTKDDVDLLKKKSHELLNETVETELDSAASSARTINPDLVDIDDIYKKAKDLDKDIRLAREGMKGESSDVIMYLDDEGRQVYAQVDPAFASLFNYRFRMDKTEASVLAKVNAATSKLFRYGTTSVNLASFGNQMFRDFGNAVLVGGAWQTIKSNADNLKDVFGENIVEQIKRFDPSGYEMRQVEAIAEQTSQSIEEAAVSRELMRGAAISPTTTERTLYRDFMKQAYGNDNDTMLTNVRTRFQEIVDKYNPEELLNGKRENYLRNRVYTSSYNDAMKSGYTVEQARVYAEFAMNNATTNFSRQLYHLQAIADSTPYFRAAINGTKSFWRMWSLDPVGITGRITGGLILPVMFLTGASLSTEENKKIYKNIPEYQKQDSLVFVFNGQIISAPIPQELGAIVAPFRQFVEYLNDSNENDFWELMMNDVLGLFPYELQGFSTIDMDKMIADPTFFDRVSRGVSRVFSQMAPVPLKSMYMLATGIDPYSGKNLRNTDYSYYDETTGSVEVMDYNQNSFAKWVATLFPNMSANLAEKIVSGIIGTTGSNLLGDITALVQEGPDAALESTVTSIGRQISKPFTVENYDLADAIWNRAVRQLNAEKEAILASDEMKVLLQQLQQTKDPNKRKELYSKISDIVSGYQQKVGDTVKRLSTEYNGTFDRKKFAATIQLLNFNTNPVFQTSIQATSDAAAQSSWNGRDQAIRTMAELGISGTNDVSIFGYLALDDRGNPIVKYSSPVAIMDLQSQWQNQDDINLANIKVLVSQNNLWDAHESVKEQVNNIYNSKKKLTNNDYAKIEAIQINWNAQVAKAIAPYLKQMSPEAALDNTEVLNYLYPLIEVPGSWEVDNRGKSVSLGDRGTKKKAYYDSWVKSMFSVNDAYKGQY